MATDPAKPRIEKVLDDVPKTTGLSGPHTYYALPGRMLLSFLGAADGGLPAGLAEFTNDGRFIRRIDNPTDAPYGYDLAVKPGLNRMVTSSFTPVRNYLKPLAQMDMKDFGRDLVVWDFKARKPIQVGKAGPTPLEVRWSLKPGADYGFTNCAFDNSIWIFRGGPDGTYAFKKVADTGPLPVDLRQSPDDRFLFVSCFGAKDIQQWDVSDPEQARALQHRRHRRAAEHDARHRRRQADVRDQLAPLDHGPLGRLLGQADPRRRQGDDRRPQVQRRPHEVPDRPRAGPRHAPELTGNSR